MAGTVAVTTAALPTAAGVVTEYAIAWTSDASGVVSGTAVPVKSGWLVMVKYAPGGGGSQPSNNYALTLPDADSVDVLAGGGAALSNAAATVAVPTVSSSFPRFVRAGSLTPTVASAGNAKSGTVYLYVR